jgi:hypothetical protein
MHGGKLGDGREIRDWIEGQGRQHGRIRRMSLIVAKRQRIAIRRRLRDRLRADNRGPTGPIIYDKGAAWDGFLQGGGKGAG